MTFSIVIVYYVYINHPHNWHALVKGQIDDLKVSGLLPASRLRICVSGPHEILEKITPSIQNQIDLWLGDFRNRVEYSVTETNQFEYPGIHLLHQLATPDQLMIYFHTKGMSQTHSPLIRSPINQLLTRTLLWNAEEIIKIFETHPDVNKVGLFPSKGGFIWFNFFWVRGSYVMTCREPPLTTRRHLYEDWLGSHGNHSYRDCYDLYSRQFGRSYEASFASIECSQLAAKARYLVQNKRPRKMIYGCGGCDGCNGCGGRWIKIPVVRLEQHRSFRVNNQWAGHDPFKGRTKQLQISFEHGVDPMVLNEGDYLVGGGGARPHSPPAISSVTDNR